MKNLKKKETVRINLNGIHALIGQPNSYGSSNQCNLESSVLVSTLKKRHLISDATRAELGLAPLEQKIVQNDSLILLAQSPPNGFYNIPMGLPITSPAQNAPASFSQPQVRPYQVLAHAVGNIGKDALKAAYVPVKLVGKGLAGIGGCALSLASLVPQYVIGNCWYETRKRIYGGDETKTEDSARLSKVINLLGSIALGVQGCATSPHSENASVAYASGVSFLFLESIVRQALREGDHRISTKHPSPGSLLGLPLTAVIASGYATKDYLANSYQTARQELLQKQAQTRRRQP
ncbi:MAG: hypothetical protein AABW82_02925 [Nanoarchaeota archaeon]